MVNKKFNELIEKYNKIIKSYESTSGKVGYLRLLAAVGAGYYIYKLFKGELLKQNIIISILLSLIFIGLVIYHGKLKEKIEEAKEMININNDYLKRVSGEWTTFEDIGSEFINREHPYSFDLDIVGEESVFQLINATVTWSGRRRLANLLLSQKLQEDEIKERQKAVEELKGKLELCQLVEYEGRKRPGSSESPQRLLKVIKKNNKLVKNKTLKNILYFMPMITICVSLIIIVFDLVMFKEWIKIFFAVQLVVWALGLMKINRIFGEISYFNTGIEAYNGILALLEKEEFQSSFLKRINGSLFEKDKSATKAMKELGAIIEKINMRNNGIFFIVLNALFLWDYQCVFSIESWKKNYGESIEGWLEGISEIEALLSISVLNHINDEATFPTIFKEPMNLEASSIGHPLIQKEVRVNNNIVMNNSIFIISGSNMSGKTTLLRSIGTNLVIAYCGGAVCSSHMVCSKMNIYTSMRITDDLKAGVSTFYGELVRIKNIIEGANRQEKMIFLIDEIFRGTNSRDRIEGAKAVIKNLNKKGVIGAITTHDLELCTMENVNKVKNYHFEEYYKDDKIYFDYKIKGGISTTTNAKYLMKIVGIKL